MVNTISHVALGDITSCSIEEKKFNSFIIWLFTFFYAFCFANIASVVSDLLGSNFLSFHENFQNVISKIHKENTPASVI